MPSERLVTKRRTLRQQSLREDRIIEVDGDILRCRVGGKERIAGNRLQRIVERILDGLRGGLSRGGRSDDIFRLALHFCDRAADYRRGRAGTELRVQSLGGGVHGFAQQLFVAGIGLKHGEALIEAVDGHIGIGQIVASEELPHGEAREL
jgi:hypothetical protein